MQVKRGQLVEFEYEGKTLTGEVRTVRTKDGRVRVEVMTALRRKENKAADGQLLNVSYESDVSVYLIPRKSLRSARP